MNAKKFSTVVAYLVISAIFFFSLLETFMGLYEATAWQGLGGIILMIFGLIAVIQIIKSVPTWFD